jgi:hypothetical protein
MEARSQQLQDELTAAYKEKAGLAEQSLQATRQLQARTAPSAGWLAGCWCWVPPTACCWNLHSNSGGSGYGSGGGSSGACTECT